MTDHASESETLPWPGGRLGWGLLMLLGAGVGYNLMYAFSKGRTAGVVFGLVLLLFWVCLIVAGLVKRRRR